MAIPTSFINYTPAAATTKTCPLVGHNGAAANIHLIDVAGTATPKMIVLDANMSIVMTATFTDAQVVAAMRNYIGNVLGGNPVGAAGGRKPDGSQQITPTHSTCT